MEDLELSPPHKLILEIMILLLIVEQEKQK